MKLKYQSRHAATLVSCCRMPLQSLGSPGRKVSLQSRPASHWLRGMMFALLAICGVAFSARAATPSFMITSVTLREGNAIISWQGGVGPFQVLLRTNLSEPWRKVGQPTTGFSLTTPVVPGPVCFYTVTTD